MQLGGYIPETMTGPPQKVKSLSETSYVVPITGMYVGTKPILSFKRANTGQNLAGSAKTASNEPGMNMPGNGAKGQFIGGILDSGATCVCLPDDTHNGELESSPWMNLMDISKDPTAVKEDLVVEIDGKIQVLCLFMCVYICVYAYVH